MEVRNGEALTNDVTENENESYEMKTRKIYLFKTNSLRQKHEWNGNMVSNE